MDIRTVENTVYPTFVEAAKAMNLIHDDREDIEAIIESHESGCSSEDLRHLFISILINNSPENAGEIFVETLHILGEDFFYHENEERR